jgi:group I intron endonuclease
MDKKYVIYTFVDQNEKVFYVGLTSDFKTRKRAHRWQASIGNKLYVYNKLRKVMRDHGLTIDDCMIALEEDIEEDKVDEREIYHIDQFRKKGYKLSNLTDGGRGSKTFSKKLHKKCAQSRKGQKRSEETRKKISEAKKGMKFSDEHKENLSKARKKRVTTEETKKRMSKSSEGKINIKKFELTDPDGNKYITENGLTQFCKKHNLNRANLVRVANGERKHSKGWKCQRLNEDGANN